MASVQEDVEANIDNDLLDLGAIMESVMGRQWFQLYVEDQVDDDIIRRRWGPATLEVFQANRDMMELQAKEDYHKDKQVVDNEGQKANVDDQQRDVKVELRVKPMSEDDDMSAASSGAKVFPRTTVVAGRRVDLEGECEARSIPGEDVAAADAVGSGHNLGHTPVEDEIDNQAALEARALLTTGLDIENMENGAGACASGSAEPGASQSCPEQQRLEDTQLEPIGASAEQGGQASTASLMDISEGEGRSDSFGEGKVQSDLAHWLK